MWSPPPKFENKAGDLCLPFTLDIPHSHLQIIDSEVGLDRFFEVVYDSVLCGIDTETKPSFSKRKTFHPTALMQIALRRTSGAEFVFILDLLALLKSGASKVAMELENSTRSKRVKEMRASLDKSLQHLFSSRKVLKVGQGLQQDLREMRESYPTMEAFKQMVNVVETNAFHRHIQPNVVQNVSLKNFTRIYLNFNLVKKQQLSDWG